MKKRKHGFNEFVGIVYKYFSIKYNADFFQTKYWDRSYNIPSNFEIFSF